MKKTNNLSRLSTPHRGVNLVKKLKGIMGPGSKTGGRGS